MSSGERRPDRKGRERTSGHLVPGAQVDYNCKRTICWLPATVESVDEETGEVTINCRKRPLSRYEGIWDLRPRTRPTEKHLKWIADVLRDGGVEYVAQKWYLMCSDEHGEGSGAGSIQQMRDLGSRIDECVGVSGSYYEIRLRATKRSRGSPDWDLTIDLKTFTGVLWEILVTVDRRYGKAFRTKHGHVGGSDELVQEYDYGKMPKLIGAGSVGEVWLAKHKATGIQRALKTVPVEYEDPPPLCQDGEGTPQLERLEGELERLRALDHPNIVRLYACYEAAGWLVLAMDYCNGGDLSEYAERLREQDRRLAEPDLARLLRQLLLAVAHVHARGILHLDIKPSNAVIVRETGTMPPRGGPDPSSRDDWAAEGAPLHLMLIDLGLARIFRPGLFRPFLTDLSLAPFGVGSPCTMAPEVWKGVETPAADVFGCGCTFFFLLSVQCPDSVRRYPFAPWPTNAEDANAFWKKRPPHGEYIAKDYSAAAYRLCDGMLVYDRLSRLTAVECLQDDFFMARDQRDHLGPKVTERLLRLVKVPERSLLYKSVALTVAKQWPAHRMPSIRKAFLELDVARTGRLQKTQIERTLVSMGVDANVAYKAADAMDLSRDGMVDWTEFVAACIQLGSDSLQDDLYGLFEEADVDKDGFLDKEGIARLLALEHGRKEIVDDLMRDLLGRNSHTARVDWKSFRRHFSSISC